MEDSLANGPALVVDGIAPASAPATPAALRSSGGWRLKVQGPLPGVAVSSAGLHKVLRWD